MNSNHLYLIKVKNITKFPSQAREAVDQNGKKKFSNIMNEVKILGDQDVFDFDDNKIKKISEYKDLYSKN